MLLPQSCGPGPPPPPPPPPPPNLIARTMQAFEFPNRATKRKAQQQSTIPTVKKMANSVGWNVSAGTEAATMASKARAGVATIDAAAAAGAAKQGVTNCVSDFSITAAAATKYDSKDSSSSNSNSDNNSNTNTNNSMEQTVELQQRQQQQLECCIPNPKLPMTSSMAMATTTKTAIVNAKTAATTTCTSAAGQLLSNSAAIKWLFTLLMLFTVLSQTPHQVAAEKSKHYYMQSLCKNHFLQQLYRKIDGAVLWSQNERNLDCIITFQTHSILQRFMLRFDMLQLDCNDHLYVYDGAHAVATPKVDISCRNTKQTVSLILTRTNFVTLKYVTDGWGTDANGFKLVITSVKDPKHTCKDFTCTTREFCISPDLLCDGINHCGDNSDESVHNLCQSESATTIFGVDMTWFVLIVVGIVLVISALIVGISICVCRRQEDVNLHQNTAIQLHHAAETNGSSKHLHYHHGGTLSREHTQLPPTSGNWHHPAGPSGYQRIMQHSLSKMATKVRPIWCWANSVN